VCERNKTEIYSVLNVWFSVLTAVCKRLYKVL